MALCSASLKTNELFELKTTSKAPIYLRGQITRIINFFIHSTVRYMYVHLHMYLFTSECNLPNLYFLLEFLNFTQKRTENFRRQEMQYFVILYAYLSIEKK